MLWLRKRKMHGVIQKIPCDAGQQVAVLANCACAERTHGLLETRLVTAEGCAIRMRSHYPKSAMG